MIRFSPLSVTLLAGALVATALPAHAHHWSSGQSYPYEPAPYPYERSPLGALLGSQVGCNAGSGRRPLPW
jgi:hypothetical protein